MVKMLQLYLILFILSYTIYEKYKTIERRNKDTIEYLLS